MSSIGVWPAPVSGICIPNDWRSTGAPCGAFLGIECYTSGAAVALDFASRGKVGFGAADSCGGSDAYLYNWPSGAVSLRLGVDVWGSYIAGVWSSSVTIDVYVYRASILSFNTGISLYKRAESGNGGTYVGGKVTGTSQLIGCGTIIKATITVTDTGSVSVV